MLAQKTGCVLVEQYVFRLYVLKNMKCFAQVQYIAGQNSREDPIDTILPQGREAFIHHKTTRSKNQISLKSPTN